MRDWDVEIVPMSGDPIRINVDVDASMGQIMGSMAKVVGSTSGRRIERIGRLVFLGTETIESFSCLHAYTRVMQTAQVRAMYDWTKWFVPSWFLTRHWMPVEVKNEAFATSELRRCDLGCSTNLRP